MKKILPISVVLLIFAAAFFSVAARTYGSNQVVDPEPLENPSMIQDPRAPAMISLAALYAPSDTQDHWIKAVCAGMTSDGCDYFKTNQADSMWESQANHDGSSGGFVESVQDINATAQVWHTQLTVFMQEEDVTSDVFVLVERGADSRWYLNRVLYGPGIPQ